MLANIQDLRSEFWRELFARADDYEAYLTASGAEHARRWRDMAGQIPALTDEQVGRISGFSRELNVLVYSGVWCGDCVRQGPMINAIAAACGDNVTLRIIDREASDNLKEELRILGGTRVPVLVFLSEDFFEVGRFGDRLLSAYRNKARKDLGDACSTGLVAPPADELASEQTDWVDVFERMLLMVRLSGMLRSRHAD